VNGLARAAATNAARIKAAKEYQKKKKATNKGKKTSSGGARGNQAVKNVKQKVGRVGGKR
jgi:hypothetical protein